MFTIDLLKGRGLPVKVKPIMVALGTVPFVIPVLAAIIMAGHYTTTSIQIVRNREALDKLNRKIEQHAPDVRFSTEVNSRIAETNKGLAEVATAVRQYCQFTSVLQILVEELPDSILFKELGVKRTEESETINDPANPDKTMIVRYVRRTLQMSVCGLSSRSTDQAVQEYLRRLQNSDILGPIIERLDVISEKDHKLDGEDVTLYKIECKFKIRK